MVEVAEAEAVESERRGSQPKDWLAGDEEEDAGEGSAGAWADWGNVTVAATAAALGGAVASMLIPLGRAELAAGRAGAEAAAGTRDDFKGRA